MPRSFVVGGDEQDQAAIQIILDTVDFGMDPVQAFEAPRFSTDHFVGSFSQDRPKLGSLNVPKSLPENVRADLRARGQTVSILHGHVGGVALIGINHRTGQDTAVGPPPEKWNRPRGAMRTDCYSKVRKRQLLLRTAHADYDFPHGKRLVLFG